jgi:DNA-binding SARP family transcriptional activator
VERQRERLQTIFARAGECLAETTIWNGEPTVAIDVAAEVIAAQAFRESAYWLLMRFHVVAGNRPEAL